MIDYRQLIDSEDIDCNLQEQKAHLSLLHAVHLQKCIAPPVNNEKSFWLEGLLLFGE
ncbi:MAG TPA: hypothetical protein VL020_04585 [Pseudomonadales bacterium]|nr:hypothetical protein [Pseudomonadales bacterium]